MKLFSLEKTIAKHISKGLAPSEIAKKISKNSDTMEVGRFLYNAGLYKQLLQFATEKLQKKKPGPWPFVIQTLTDHKIKIPKKQAKMLYKNILAKYEKQNSPYIFACKGFSNSFQEFALFRTVFLEKLREKNISIKKELLKKLEFVQSQELIDEERQLIKQLLEMEPNNKHYLHFQENLKEKTARQLIKKHKQKLSLKKEPSLLLATTDNPFKKELLKEVSKAVRQHPERVKDIAVFLYMMGWPDAALKLLDQVNENTENYWFYLEWLIEIKQYTASVELCQQLLENTDGDPEKLFLINYIKAQALYHLGEKKEAIKYLNDILTIRPDYKSAGSLMEKWMSK